ncbi:hypothetical protein SAMN04487939_11189 [Lysobacter sp. yr284]|uniref:helix-turn-helix transcriptional regulator n=1 Tax=Lysobacter sp. yr284 TaxID=1761791 RepID=UPI00089503A9|nr:hypothetical protein [Lysobacter sp. yr284]SDY99753.1 hypothetical protein SAMN04487939_11189 [Lysobacter sp. yr284]
MASDGDYDRLLGDLYGAIADPERWQDFLRGLCAATGSHIALVLQQDFSAGTASIPLISGAGAQELLRYETEFASENIWFERALPHIRTGSVNFSDDHCPKRDFKRSRYYADFLRHADVCHSVGMCAQLERDHGAFLTFCRSERAGAYAHEQRALCERLAGHWVNAHALFRRVEGLRLRSHWAEQGRNGAFVLDRDFRVVDRNHAAEIMHSIGWWRSRGSSELMPVCATTCGYWRAAKKQVGAGDTGCSALFPVHDASRCVVAFASLRAFIGAGDTGVHYLLIVAPLRSAEPSVSAARLKALFMLTDAETRLALALREHGDLHAAADAVGIAKASARARLQSIFDKTGQHKQADLVRMMDALSAMPD